MNPAKPTLALLITVFLSGALMGQGTPKLTPDAEARAAYAKIDSTRDAMNGELKDEERSKKMAEFQQACRKYVETWESRSGELNFALFDLGRAAIQSFSPEKAIGFLQTFIKKNPKAKETPEAKMFLGDALRAVNKATEAIALYRSFITTYPKHELLPAARLGLATALFLGLEFNASVKQYREILEKHPKHEVRGDAAYQLLNALVYAGRFDEARAHLAELQKEAPEAPELAQKKQQFELLGKSAPELSGIVGWQGLPGTSVGRMRGRVLVLCFFMTKNIPCARTLQSLSSLENELQVSGVTVWGLTKTYKAGKGDWTVDKENKWLGRYRENPRFVLEKELRYQRKGGLEEERVWGPLEKPITVTLALTRDIENLKAYRIRRVPTVIVIDKNGMVRLVEEGGQPEGGFQSQMLRRLVKRIAIE